MVTNQEMMFGKQALVLQMIDRNQLSLCVKIQKEMAQNGEAPSLPQILIQKGFLTTLQVSQIQQQLKNSNVMEEVGANLGASQGGNYNVAQTMAGDPRNLSADATLSEADMANYGAPQNFSTNATVSEAEQPAFTTNATISEGSNPLKMSADATISEADQPAFTTDATISEGTFDVNNGQTMGMANTAQEINPTMQRKTAPSIHHTLGDNVSMSGSTAAMPSIGRYKIQKEIGRGGMGRVYEAVDPNLDRTVALKVILNEGGETGIQRFIREAKTTAKLNHPNIVTIYDMGEEKGQFFFTMDFIEGDPLNKLAKKENLTTKRIAHIMAKVSAAVFYAHQQGVIHRDLKPANIMMEKNKEPKVMDFGLAKMTEHDSKLSQSGVILGTLLYMPPEQAEGKIKDIDHRSDIYALGAILYELLTKKVPFQGDSFFQVLSQIVNAPPVAPTEIRGDIPKVLENICLKAMAKKKEERYQTAAAMSNDLMRFIRGEAVNASPVGSTQVKQMPKKDIEATQIKQRVAPAKQTAQKRPRTAAVKMQPKRSARPQKNNSAIYMTVGALLIMVMAFFMFMGNKQELPSLEIMDIELVDNLDTAQTEFAHGEKIYVKFNWEVNSVIADIDSKIKIFGTNVNLKEKTYSDGGQSKRTAKLPVLLSKKSGDYSLTVQIDIGETDAEKTLEFSVAAPVKVLKPKITLELAFLDESETERETFDKGEEVKLMVKWEAINIPEELKEIKIDVSGSGLESGSNSVDISTMGMEFPLVFTPPEVKKYKIHVKASIGDAKEEKSVELDIKKPVLSLAGNKDNKRPPRGNGGFEDNKKPPRGNRGIEDNKRPPRGNRGIEDNKRPPRGNRGFEDNKRPRGNRGFEDNKRPRGNRGFEDNRRPPRGNRDNRRPPRGNRGFEDNDDFEDDRRPRRGKKDGFRRGPRGNDDFEDDRRHRDRRPRHNDDRGPHNRRPRHGNESKHDVYNLVRNNDHLFGRGDHNLRRKIHHAIEDRVLHHPDAKDIERRHPKATLDLDYDKRENLWTLLFREKGAVVADINFTEEGDVEEEDEEDIDDVAERVVNRKRWKTKKDRVRAKKALIKLMRDKKTDFLIQKYDPEEIKIYITLSGSKYHVKFKVKGRTRVEAYVYRSSGKIKWVKIVRK